MFKQAGSMLLVLLLTISGCSGDIPDTATDSNQQSTITKEQMATEVKAEFVHAWNAYKEFAWGHDQLSPLSEGFRDWYEKPMLFTAVDAVDTLYLMGLDDEAEETIDFIKANLEFEIDSPVKHFEVVIRVLGGLISAYQFSGDEALLDLARALADRMLPVFDSPTGMPYQFINLKTGEVSGKISNPAEIGTIQLEYGVLSKLTGDETYWQKAKNAAIRLFEKRSELDLAGEQIDVETGEWVSIKSHIDGYIDSWYEYLLKCYLLFGDQEFKDMFDVSIAAVLQYLPEEAETGTYFRQVDMNTGEVISRKWTALGAFMPGLLALADQEELAVATQRTNRTVWGKFGIEPEVVDYENWQIDHAGYVLRPEIMESGWYLYSMTADATYLEMNYQFFQDIKEHCRVENGYAALKDVTTGERADQMESFFLAETLKYLYLTFDEEANARVKEAVFNTEAHPFFKTW